MRPRYWLPPALWMAVILWFSSDVGSAEHTGHWLLPLLKTLAALLALPANLLEPEHLPSGLLASS